MEGSVFTPCLEGLKHVKSEHGEMLSKPFLDVCKTILPVLGYKKDKFFEWSFFTVECVSYFFGFIFFGSCLIFR